MGPPRIAIAAASCTLAVLGALLLASCGEQREAVAPACFGTPASLLSTLRAGPPIALEGQTRLSSCVSAARTDGDLQSLGVLFIRAADELRRQARSDPGAAFALGYLSGAVSRGAAASSGAIAAQLTRRLDQVATLDPGADTAAMAALARGRGAGWRDG